MINQQQLEVIQWWHKGCDYTQGVMLFARFSRNKVLKQTFQNKHPKFGQQKLNYELTKVVGLDWKNMPENIETDEVQNPIPTKTDGAKVSDLALIENSEEILPDGKQTGSDSSKFLPLISEKTLSQYPKIIRRIKYLYAEYYRERSKLHRQMSAVPEDNTLQNVAIRAGLLEKIKQHSLQMDYFYDFIREYENKGTIPEESSIIFPDNSLVPDSTENHKNHFVPEIPKIPETDNNVKSHEITETHEIAESHEITKYPEKTEPAANIEALEMQSGNTQINSDDRTIENIQDNLNKADEKSTDEIRSSLKRKKKNLQTANTKDNNLLLYQNKSKLDSKHPMPEGPKRTKIETRIKNRKLQINDIETQLSELEN